uniref:Uncharacterized protein n=1 Tax=Homalodisca liturata TaxID=320908 RepID=A0A1B6IW69_9HEMI
MSQNLVDVCKMRETNQNEVAQTLKNIEQRRIHVQNKSKLLKDKVDKLKHEHVLLDKEMSCTESLNLKIEKEICKLKAETENTACSLEKMHWKSFKIEMLKDFESERNANLEQRKLKYENVFSQSSNNDTSNKDHQINSNRTENHDIKEMEERVNEMVKVIESKKTSIQLTDPKLQVDIQILEKRNAALLTRYQRKFQEAESRYRQKLSELNSLQKLLAEKDELLLNQNETRYQ